MSDLARDVIAQNKTTKETYLDLGNCGLTAIPEELRELSWLQSVSLASVWEEWSGESWEQRLSQNSGAPNGRVDLTPLAGLTALQTLTLSGAQVADLTPLAGLTALRTLDVSGSPVADLTPLAGLTALQTLDVSDSEVADLTPLAGLTALQTLIMAGSQVADLTPRPVLRLGKALSQG